MLRFRHRDGEVIGRQRADCRKGINANRQACEVLRRESEDPSVRRVEVRADGGIPEGAVGEAPDRLADVAADGECTAVPRHRFFKEGQRPENRAGRADVQPEQPLGRLLLADGCVDDLVPVQVNADISAVRPDFQHQCGDIHTADLDTRDLAARRPELYNVTVLIVVRDQVVAHIRFGAEYQRCRRTGAHIERCRVDEIGAARTEEQEAVTGGRFPDEPRLREVPATGISAVRYDRQVGLDRAVRDRDGDVPARVPGGGAHDRSALGFRRDGDALVGSREGDVLVAGYDLPCDVRAGGGVAEHVAGGRQRPVQLHVRAIDVQHRFIGHTAVAPDARDPVHRHFLDRHLAPDRERCPRRVRRGERQQVERSGEVLAEDLHATLVNQDVEGLFIAAGDAARKPRRVVAEVQPRVARVAAIDVIAGLCRPADLHIFLCVHVDADGDRRP